MELARDLQTDTQGETNSHPGTRSEMEAENVLFFSSKEFNRLQSQIGGQHNQTF